MSTKPNLAAQPPQAFTDTEIQDFIAMVRIGGEVGNVDLEQNVRNAKCLVVIRRDSSLIGIEALKNPQTNYRHKIETKSGVDVIPQELPIEFG